MSENVDFFKLPFLLYFSVKLFKKNRMIVAVEYSLLFWTDGVLLQDCAAERSDVKLL